MATASDEGNKQIAIIALQAAVPEDLIQHILSFLSLSSLLSFQLTCKSLHEIANRPSFWETKFRDLVKTKMFIPRNAMASFKESFKIAYQDRFRTTIEKEELVGRVWYFWLKHSVGDERTCWDPFWASKGRTCRKFVFSEDGALLKCQIEPARNRHSTQVQPRTTDAAANSGISQVQTPVYGSNCFVLSNATGVKRSRVGEVVNEGSLRRNTPHHQQAELRRGSNSANSNNILSEDPSSHYYHRRISMDHNSIIPLEASNDDEVDTSNPDNSRAVFYNEPNIPHSVVMKWRFITHPLDFRPREKMGGFIRILIGGREVPTYVVRRLSNDNWGFILESCWGVFCSFNVARNANNDENYMKQFREDAKWNTLTTTIQWKEALLYNNGANTLPEGNR